MTKARCGCVFLASMKGVYFKSPSPRSVLAFSKTRLVSFLVIPLHPQHQIPHEFSLNFYISHCSYCGVIFASEKAVGANNLPPCIWTMEGMHWGNSHSVTLKTNFYAVSIFLGILAVLLWQYVCRVSLKYTNECIHFSSYCFFYVYAN